MNLWKNLAFLVDGLDSTDLETGETLKYDWADRCAILGFHGERTRWLRNLGRSSYCPMVVNRGSYPNRCRCESCRRRRS